MQQKGAKQNQPQGKVKPQARSTQTSRLSVQKGKVPTRSREQRGQLATNFSSHLNLIQKQKTESLEDLLDQNYHGVSNKLNPDYYNNTKKNYTSAKSVLDLISQEYHQANEQQQVKTTRNLNVGGFLRGKKEKHKVPQQMAVQINLSSENITIVKKKDKSMNESNEVTQTKSCILEGGKETSGTQNTQNVTGNASNVSNKSGGPSIIKIQASGGMQNYPKPSLTFSMLPKHQAPALQSKRGSIMSRANANLADGNASQGSAYQQSNTLGNCASSIGTAKSNGTMNATASQSSNTKRVYQYCIDTRQIINMIDFAAKMISVSQQEIQSKVEQIQRTQKANMSNKEIIQEIYQQRSKSSSDSQDQIEKVIDSKSRNRSSQNKVMGENGQNSTQQRVDIFCAGNKDLKNLVTYVNHILKEPQIQSPTSKGKGGKSELFKKTGGSTKFFDRSKNMDFARLFALDDDSQKQLAAWQAKNGGEPIDQKLPLMTCPRFTYFVENEKILSRQMFFVELQRETFEQDLQELKSLLQSFIQRKYKNVGVTKIGFSSERELFNIFKKMFNNKNGFFNKNSVRKILSQFWMSVREIFQGIRLRTGVWQVNNIGSFDEYVLRKNFYVRLEIVARGRYIYEPHVQQHAGSEEQMLQINPNKDSSSSFSTQGASSGKFYNILYPVHQALFESNLRHLSKLLKQEVEGVFYCERNQLDPCGNTPLTLAVKLGNIDAVKILSDLYTCPKLRPLDELMNSKEIAIAMKSQPILKILIGSNQKIKQQFFEQNKEAIFKVLERMPDFKVDLNLTCDSNWFPVFSSVAPSDTYKIYKQGSNLRLDMSLLGLQKFNLIKGNISVLYKGRGSENEGNLLIIDNKLQTVSNIFNRNNEQKVNSEIQDILTGKQILKKYQTLQVQHELDSDKPKKINGFESEKYTLKSRYNMVKYQMNLAQIDQIKGIQSFEQYVDLMQIEFVQLIQLHLNNQELQPDSPKNDFFKANGPTAAPLTSRPNLGGTTRVGDGNAGGLSSRERPKFTNFEHYNYTQEDQIDRKQTILQNNKQITVKKKTLKNINASLWLSKSYPFDLEKFLPLIHVLSFCSKQIRQFNKFLLKYPLPEKCFPVEARIPLFMSMEAIFSFKNIQLDFSDESVFDLDKEVAIKQSQNMALYAKQQISYLNMNSVDTQEDKQAKALKEIYKLCKTDEGDHSNDSHDNLYRGMDKGIREEGYESENSDKIKDLFNQMMSNKDEAYDIKIEHVEDNSRNQAQGVGLSDLRNSLSHSDLLKLRKSGLGGIIGKTPSKQFSMNSDITESVEVSERSFNDKLAKLQIHSFQNVKFMSQFKPNAVTDAKFQNLLAAQFADSAGPLSRLEQFQAHSAISKRIERPHHRNSSSQVSSLNHENIYDSKLNEERPKINKSLGKHQINNNLHMWTKAGAKIYKEGQWISQGRQVNMAHQLGNIGHINQSQSIVSGSQVNKAFQPRAVPRLRVNLPGDQQCSSIEGASDSGMSSLGSGLLQQSMSNLSSILIGGHNQVGKGSVVSSTQGFSINNKFGPNSTLDSSGHHQLGHGSQPSINSIGSRKVNNQEQSKLKPSILDKNKLKLILENLRNDHPQKLTPTGSNQARPRYLNTIESEGNLPTQYGEKRKDHRASLLSRASKGNELSQRSIHSLESLKSEGSLEEEKKMHSGNSDYNFNQESTNEQNIIQQKFRYEKTRKENDSQTRGALNIFQKFGNYIQESITERKHNEYPGPSTHRSNEDDLFNKEIFAMKKLKKVVRSPIGAQKGSPMTAKFDAGAAQFLRVDINNTEQSENKNMVQPNKFLLEK